MCLVICESSSRAHVLTKPSVSVTSQTEKEKLPDVVPDQRRITEDETTEVGAVCFSLLTVTVNNRHHCGVLCTFLLLPDILFVLYFCFMDAFSHFS